MIEYVDFFETPTANLPTVTDTTTLQCPRCNSAVAATPGICPNCGENVFQVRIKKIKVLDFHSEHIEKLLEFR
jgi:hypothetical protein